MTKFQIVFTVKNGFHPFTEVVEAVSVDQAREIVKQLIRDAGLTLKQITSIVQL